MDNKEVVFTYSQLQSLVKTGDVFGISASKVKKILISEGVYENDTLRKVQKLYKSGKTPDEISQILNIKKSCVNLYLPYKKGVYNSDTPTINAERIRRCRQKKKCT